MLNSQFHPKLLQNKEDILNSVVVYYLPQNCLNYLLFYFHHRHHLSHEEKNSNSVRITYR